MKRAAWIVGGTLGVALLLAALALLALATPVGGAQVRRIGLRAVNNALAGHIESREVHYLGNGLRLRGVVLKDPDGVIVAQAEEVEAHVSLLPALRRHVVVTELRLVRPQLELTRDEQGFNLLKALAARHPSPDASPDAPGSPPLLVTVKALDLVDGSLHVRLPAEPTDRQFRLEMLYAHASALYGGSAQHLDGTLDLAALGTVPFSRPVALRTHFRGTLGDSLTKLTGSLQLALFGIQAKAEGALHGDHLQATVSQLDVSPAAARLGLSSYPVRVPVRLQARISKDAGQLEGQLTAQAGHGTLTFQARGNLDERAIGKLEVRMRDLDFSELMGKGPKTALGLDLSGHLRGAEVKTLQGALSLEIPASRIRDERVGPLSVQAQADHGAIAIPHLDVQLPGLHVTGVGSGTREQLRFVAKLIAPDLARLGRTLSGLGGAPAIALAGGGILEVTATGPLDDLALGAQGAFGKLVLGATRLQRLVLTARVPSLKRPLDASGRVTLEHLTLSGHAFEQVNFSLAREGPKLTIDLSSAGDAPLLLSAEAQVDPDALGLVLSRLALRYPEESWELEQTAHLRLFSKALSIDHLSLRSGGQHLQLAAQKEGDRVQAHLALVAVDLAHFPSWAVPASMQLGGRLDVEAHVSGLLTQPPLQAHVRLLQGHYQRLRDVSIELNASYLHDRAQGSLNVGMDGPRLTMQFDVPIQALLHARHQKLKLDIDLPTQTLEKVVCGPGLSPQERAARVCVWDAPLPLSGRVGGSLSVGGFADEPLLALHLQAEQLQVDRAGPIQLQLELSNPRMRDVRGRMSALLPHGKLAADVVIERSLSELRTEAQGKPQWSQLPVQLKLEGVALDLAQLDSAGLSPQPIAGQLELNAHLAGPLEALVGELQAQVSGLTTDGVPSPLDAQVAFQSEARHVALSLHATHAGANVADLKARIETGLTSLQNPARLFRTPLQVSGSLGPLSLQEARKSLSNREDLPHLHGDAEATLQLNGSLEAPRMKLDLTVKSLSASNNGELGDVHLRYNYADTAHALEAELTSKGSGQLLLTAKTKLDVSAPAMRRGVRAGSAPLEAKLSSKQFELGFLSGVVSEVRTVGGVLDTDVHVGGTLGAPTGLGRFEWQKGLVALEGFGDYSDIHLLLSATEQKISLTELRAKAEGGTLLLKAEGARAGSLFHLTGSGDLRRFPIVIDDQLLANLSLRTSFEGELSPMLVNLKRLSIPDATLELPDSKRKDLQALDAPADVVLVRNGVPLRKHQTAIADASASKPTVKTPNSAPQRRYRAVIEAPRSLWIKGSDINAELGLSDDFRFEYASTPEIYGQVRVLRGRVDVLGRRFDLHRDSTVRLNGPILRPDLNVTAEYFNEKESVHVYINVEGQGKTMSIKPSSDPPLSDSEIYTLLATGRRTLARNSSASASGADQAASILGSVAAGELKKQLKDKLPLDVISIETGGSNYGLGGAKLEAGTYLTDKLYLGYAGQLGADRSRGQNANAAQLEYQLGPRWGLEASFGDAYVGGADLIWNKDF